MPHLLQQHGIVHVRPAKGTRVIARAAAKSVGRRQAVCQRAIHVVAQGEEKLCALAQGTVVLAAADSGPAA